MWKLRGCESWLAFSTCWWMDRSLVGMVQKSTVQNVWCFEGPIPIGSIRCFQGPPQPVLKEIDWAYHRTVPSSTHEKFVIRFLDCLHKQPGLSYLYSNSVCFSQPLHLSFPKAPNSGTSSTAATWRRRPCGRRRGRRRRRRRCGARRSKAWSWRGRFRCQRGRKRKCFLVCVFFRFFPSFSSETSVLFQGFPWFSLVYLGFCRCQKKKTFFILFLIASFFGDDEATPIQSLFFLFWGVVYVGFVCCLGGEVVL